MLLRFAFAVPVFGWLLRDAVRGGTSARFWFIANLAMLWLLAISFFGYAAFIIPVIILALGMLAVLVMLTAG